MGSARTLTATLLAMILGLGARSAEARPHAPPSSGKHARRAASPADATWLTPFDSGPFLRVRGGALQGLPCGKGDRYPGASPRSHWTAVDVWGQPTGTAVVKGTHVYDLSGCRELDLTLVQGRLAGAPLDQGQAPAVLHVHTKGPYVPPPSAECRSKEASLRASFRSFARAFGAGVAARPPQVFCMRSAGVSTEVVRVVFGGDRLVIGRLERSGRWKAELVSPKDQRYVVMGVFDMNGDGKPEVVVHRMAADTYDDVVYALDPEGRWRVAVETDGSGYA